MSDSAQPAGFAGMPGPSNAPQARASVRYPIPAKYLGADWATSGLDDKYATFTISEITPLEQEQAAKISGTGPEKAAILSKELTFKTIRTIGDVDPHKDRQFLEKWWKAIGPKGRRLVEAAFLRMSSVTEADIDTFLDSGVPV